ncbi:cell cycle checkpoint protein RAD17 [Drosophila grimshawi]|uniref:GH18931 n=1 Tax=Drosophila grimshawi TaxID=7222 RepID=B4JH55_DROGR|nr:cell cycle checkpoint protein RAD17 [Drosophila grimshawi]EDV92746.1 GH18931 [Drosophila grimshawi]
MSAKKKPWVKSAFSDLNLIQKASPDPLPVKRTRSATVAAAAGSKSERKIVKPTTDEVVDLTDNGEDGGDTAPVVSDNWMESFAPSVSDELAVHPKKIADVRNWLQHCEAMRKKYPAQICLLTGPAGCGKTAAVRVLTKELGYALQEWINPVDCEEINALGDQPEGSYVGSQLQAFKSFLLRASRYKSLLAAHNKRLLLVEDFPNALLKDAASTFEDLLDEYVNYGKSPLIFIVADSKSRMLNISYKLFTDQLKTKLRIEHISFNAIASTIMQKSMKRFATLMQQQEQHKALYKAPTQNVLDSIVVCAQGDIRNALINLHFGSLRGAPSMATKQLTNITSAAGKGRKRKATSTLKSIGRDESITMMHALGRVFNPKYTEDKDKDKQLLHSPETLAEAFCTEPRNFVNFIHANYLPHFQDISHVNAAVDDIGLSDMLLQEYRDDSLALVGLTVAVRGCMVANVAPISGWMPVRGPKRPTIQPPLSGPEQRLMGVAYAGISKRLYASEFSSFVKTIASKRN